MLGNLDAGCCDDDSAHDFRYGDCGADTPAAFSATFPAWSPGLAPVADRALARDRSNRARPVVRYRRQARTEEHTSELQSLMRISYAVFCLKKKKQKITTIEPKHLTTKNMTSSQSNTL